MTLRRRPGKVTLRDYNQEKPAVKLEAVETGGTPLEQEVEVYEAPGAMALCHGPVIWKRVAASFS